MYSGNVNLPVIVFISIEIEGGTSLETTGTSDRLGKYGMALGLNYLMHISTVFNLNSFSYYSSPYFGGLRRGLLQLDNNASIALGAGSNWLCGSIWSGMISF